MGGLPAWAIGIFILLGILVDYSLEAKFNIFGQPYDKLDQKYGSFTSQMKLDSLAQVEKMFYFAYDSYMQYAFPLDELDPIHCTGRGPDHENP